MKISVAGATGAVGLPLVRVLCALGHQVSGMTRAGTGCPLVSVEDTLKAAGEEVVYYHTRLTRASNKRAKAKLGFTSRLLL